MVHNFGTPDALDLRTAPQQSGPTGETVANRDADVKLTAPHLA